MAGATSIVDGFLTDFPTPILPKIGGEPTREGLIKIHQLMLGNVASVTSNLRGGGHRYLVLTMTSKEYIEHKGFAFVPPHNPGNNYSQIMRSAQEHALGTEKFRQIKRCFENTPPWMEP